MVWEGVFAQAEIILINQCNKEIIGGEIEPANQLSWRGEAKSFERLRKLVLRFAYAGLGSDPPGRDCGPHVSSEVPLLVDSGDGLSIPHIAEVSFLPAIGQQSGTEHRCTFTRLITDACVDNSIGAVLSEL